LVVHTKATGNLKSADESSRASTTRRTVGGSWGDVPIAPANLTVGRVTHDGMLLSFNAPTRSNGGNITRYMVSYMVFGMEQPARMIDAAVGLGDGKGAVLGSFQQYFLGNLQPGTAHASVRVRAMNFFGGGADSNALDVTTMQSGSFYFSKAESRVDNNMGKALVVTITVARHGGAEEATMVEYENSFGLTGKLRFPVGSTEQTFTFTVDTTAAAYSSMPDGTIKLELSNPTHGATLAYPSTSHVALAKSVSGNKRDTYAILRDGQSLFDFRSYEEHAYATPVGTRAEVNHNY